MSAYFAANVVVGIKVSEIYKEEFISAEVTKYNPDTGVPYQSKIVNKKFFLFGHEIAQPVEPHPDEWKALRIPGLKIYSIGGCRKDYDYDMFVFGISIAKSEDMNYGGCIEAITDIEVTYKRFFEAIEPLMKAMKTVIVPSLYLVTYVSY